VAVFFIDTDTGQVATRKQLIAAGRASEVEDPPRPWLRIQGSDDTTTMWYAVLRKRERGIFIGALAIRHGDHHASLLQAGWEDVALEELRAGVSSGGASAA
jgi:alpha/beta superfamily hydrolase